MPECSTIAGGKMNNLDIASLINIGLVIFYLVAIISSLIYAIKFDD